MEPAQVWGGSALMVLVVWATTLAAEATAGPTAAIRDRAMLPSGRRSVRTSRRGPALTSWGGTAGLRGWTPAVMPRMVFSGSPPDGRAAPKAHTGPEVSWLARCA